VRPRSLLTNDLALSTFATRVPRFVVMRQPAGRTDIGQGTRPLAPDIGRSFLPQNGSPVGSYVHYR
jgi:hypothetical protein